MTDGGSEGSSYKSACGPSSLHRRKRRGGREGERRKGGRERGGREGGEGNKEEERWREGVEGKGRKEERG